MQLLRAEDLEVRCSLLGEKTSFYHGDRLLFTVSDTPDVIENWWKEAICQCFNTTHTAGMELGRRMLQEEICEALGVANASRA